MRLGLVTYMWGANWDLPTIIKYLEASNVLGVELRVEHAHKVEPSLSTQERKDVKKRFDDSPVVLVGIGSNQCYDNPDPTVLKQSIERTKEYVKLCHDVGATGLKVKPNDFHKGVDHQKTIEQIGNSLNEVGRFAADYGQKIRLEVHGQCCPPPIMKQIMDVADNPNVYICWNSNPADLAGEGLEHNFNLLKDRFGDTCHTRTMDDKSYPFQKLINLLAAMDYDGWLLMECSNTPPSDPVAEFKRQNELLKQMIAGR